MGHCIKAIIGDKDLVENIKTQVLMTDLHIEKLPKNYYLIYYGESLADYILRRSEGLSPLSYLQNMLYPIEFVVIETDYFGGLGEQTAALAKKDEEIQIAFSDGKDIDRNLAYPERLLNEPINKMLRGLGIQRDVDKDEFDSLNLWKYRRMKD